jgi:hypothetical protein
MRDPRGRVSCDWGRLKHAPWFVNMPMIRAVNSGLGNLHCFNPNYFLGQAVWKDGSFGGYCLLSGAMMAQSAIVSGCFNLKRESPSQTKGT